MTIIARPFRWTEEAPRRVRIQATDIHFFQAFAQGYHFAQRDSGNVPLTEDTIFGFLRRAMILPELTPRWKAGLITGWFAALYHIAWTFDEQSTPPAHQPAISTQYRPRPIEICYLDPHFPTAYGAGYQAFFAVVGEQPATDDGLYAELARDYTPALGHQSLEEARWCAGYIAGFMAALFRRGSPACPCASQRGKERPMNERHAVPRRASLPPEELRTTQEYTLSHQAMRQSATDVWNNEEEREGHATRLPTSARRYTTRDGQQLVPVQQPPRSAKRQKHPFLYVGVGMLTTLTAATLIFGPGGKWWADWRNYTDYSDPRTFQTDAIVGQEDGPGHPSHFIVLNLHGQIIVIDFPGDDPSKGRDFLITTLYGPNAAGVPVTLTFADVNGDGKPDMILHFEGQQVVYLNDHDTFRPAKPGEVTNSNG